MFNTMTQENFLQLASTHARVAIFKEILGDELTPVQAFNALRAHMQGATLLESSPKEKAAGRYSLLGFTEQAQLCIKGTQIEIKDANGLKQTQGDALAAVRDFYKKMHAHTAHPLSGFAGGIAGFVSYDAARLFEPVLQENFTESNFPDFLFKSYQDHLMFDLQTGQVVLSTIVETTGDKLNAYQQGVTRLQDFYQQLTTPHATVADLVNDDGVEENNVSSVNKNDPDYIQGGERAKEHILAGDIFQIVLARTFKMKFNAKPFDIYRALRFRNPSPYMFYLDNHDYIICGASPEKMVSVKNNIVQSCPLAGTRPRGVGYDDEMQSADLLADTKEVAEHMMLVDLARNDIGSVAKPGSVSVTALKQIHKFSHVMHISSTVEAKLADNKDALDALRASFPAGTLSGAPKIRAMQLIQDIEQSPRQLYGGAICFLDSQGNFDSCIAIRMALLKQGYAYVSAGAGIVADSDLQKEADETRHKASAVLEAILFAKRGLA